MIHLGAWGHWRAGTFHHGHGPSASSGPVETLFQDGEQNFLGWLHTTVRGMNVRGKLTLECHALKARPPETFLGRFSFHFEEENCFKPRNEIVKMKEVDINWVYLTLNSEGLNPLVPIILFQ